MNREKFFDLSMLVLRVVLGAIFLAHGGQKLFGMFNGIGLEGTAKIVEGLGFPKPYLLALAWGCVEFIGGVFLILGILARWSALAITMVVIIQLWKINLPYGFFIQNGGMEYSLLVVGSCLPVILMGGGSWSVWDA